MGKQFALYHRVSQAKFPILKKNSVVTISFCGLHLNATPKFPSLVEIHDDQDWDEIIPYTFNFGR